MPKFRNGFTLVELLVVISILGVLASIALSAFRSSQIKGRDTQRKSDLKQISNSLELYYADYGSYPDSSGGKISGCPSTLKTVCTWGSGEFTDTKTVYFKDLPKDPVSSNNYYYRIVDASNQKYQLFAHLENSEDPNCLENNCTSPTVPSGVSCQENCNFAVTSTNTKATE